MNGLVLIVIGLAMAFDAHLAALVLVGVGAFKILVAK